MKILLAQVKLRMANFEYNYNKFKEYIDNSADLTIFADMELNECMRTDSFCCTRQNEIYDKIASDYPTSAILIGKLLIKDGIVYDLTDGFFDLLDKKVYVCDRYDENIECDLYILSKNSYYAMGSYPKFIESIVAKTNFIYVNSIGLSEENVFAGGSFVKNSENELVLKMPIVKEVSEIIFFDNPIKNEVLQWQEEVFKVITFALKEYCEINGFSQVLLGLSGGVDSALTAVLAKESLGSKNVHTIMLPSMYSSSGSIDDSIKLAGTLGIDNKEISITPLFFNFIENVSKEKKSDLAEENLQSRLRGLILMFESNRKNYLLLTTGNKSEIACGYGTLYGDMCGGINLIADLTKSKVYELSNWINRNGEIIPHEIIEKAPSAELRPNQKDEDSLPEYAVLDEIIEMYVEDKLPLDEIYKKFDKELVCKVLRLVYRAQFKRNQTCLGIRLTENAFCSNIAYPVVQCCY